MPDRPDSSQKADTQFSNTGLDKLSNELSVLNDGLWKSRESVVQSAQKAVHDPATLLKVGTSAALGLGIGVLAGKTGVLGFIGRGVGIAATTSMLFDGAKPFYNAITSTWNATSSSQLNLASTKLGNALGDFAVDFAIQTPGAMAGGGLARFFEPGRGAGLLKGWRSEFEPDLTGINFKGAQLEPIRYRYPHERTATPDLESPASVGTDARKPDPGLADVVKVVTAPARTEPSALLAATDEGKLSIDEARRTATTTAPETSSSNAAESTQAKAMAPAQQESHTTVTSEESKSYANDSNSRPSTHESTGSATERVAARTEETGSSRSSNPQPTERIYAPPKVKHVTASGTEIKGFDFVEVKKTDMEIAPFDFGVGIDEQALLNGRRNVISARQSEDSQSLALSALFCPTKRLPKVGKTLAISERNADTLTALAVLANRAESRKNNEALVKLVANHGIGTFNEDALKGYKAIALMSEQEGVKIGDRVRFIRSVLDGSTTKGVLNARATEYDAMRQSAFPEGVHAKTSSGVRHIGGSQVYSYRLAPARDGVEYSIGISDRNLSGDTKVIDQQGSQNIVERALKMPDDELPPAGAGVLFAEVDLNRLTAAAILENRVEGNPMRKSLLDFILRKGTQSERIPDAERENVVHAYQAMEGFSNDPHIHPSKKVAAIKNLLAHDVPAAKLLPIIYEFGLFQSSAQPFKYVKTSPFKPKPFDFGVEITDPALVQSQPNIVHPRSDMVSAAEQALLMDESQLPARGARVAIQKPDADALTAIAVMANRIDGVPVNARLVEAVGRRDRGFDTDAEGKSYDDIEAPFIAIRSFARNKNILLQQRICAIRALLSGMMQETELSGLVDRFQDRQERERDYTERTSTITEHVPGKMVFVETPMENWYTARALGLKQAPVAVIAATTGNRTHFEVLAKNGDPVTDRLGKALAELQTLERGWGGHDYIFVSPHASRLTPEQVLEVVSRHAFGTSADNSGAAVQSAAAGH